MSGRNGNENTVFERKLGALETMYQVYYERGMDTFSQMVGLTTENQLHLHDVRNALQLLVEKHPLLQMSIQKMEGSNEYCFVRMYQECVYIMTSAEKISDLLHEEATVPFAENGPLWRFTVSEKMDMCQSYRTTSAYNAKRTMSILNNGKRSIDKRQHSFHFVFTIHHSIADGRYLKIIISDFIEILDLFQRNKLISKKINNGNACISPPIEHFLKPIKDDLPNSKLGTVLNMNDENANCRANALEVYERHFSSEIKFLASNLQHTFVTRVMLEKTKARNFLLQCKWYKCTLTSAVISASCVSFAKLLRQSFPEKTSVLDIPVEVMVDMRRYIPRTDQFTYFQGAAAFHLPYLATIHMNEDNHSKTLFLKIAKHCTDHLRDVLNSTIPIQFMRKEVEEEIKKVPCPRKSPFVLCVTNLSNAENVLKAEQRKRFRVTEYSAMTPICISNSPIFEIGFFSLSDQLCIDVAYCGRYTSCETAAKFSWNILSCLQESSRL